MFPFRRIKDKGSLWAFAGLCCGVFLAGFSFTVQAAGLSAAPVNPDFLQYQQNRTLRAAQGLSAEGPELSADDHVLSFRPSPLKRPAVTSKALQSANEALPATFDLRTVGGVTPVKDQGSCGSCWTFATYGSMESYLQYANWSHKTWSFSEEDMNDRHGFDLRPCQGGNFDMATAYLTRWDGPVTSRDVPYLYAGSSQKAASDATVRKHIQNVWYLSDRANYTDNSEVKNAIMTRGGVAVGFYYHAAYYNATNVAYYYGVTSVTSPNHAVTLVGWDDNYAKSNFTAGKQPPGDGAFIVKNSWGTSWGQDGYFYLSYYDKVLSMMTSFSYAEMPTNYQHIYQYDPLGWTTSIGYSSTTAWFANVFTAEAGAENIKAIGLYSPVPSTKYQVYIYRDVSGDNPKNGVLLKTLKGTMEKPGYHTLKTFKASEDPPSVTAGSQFSVVVKLTTPGYYFPIPIEREYSGYSSMAGANTGQSYISAGGATWSDLTAQSIGSSSLKKANVCLKAFGG